MTRAIVKYGLLLAILFGALSLITYYAGSSLNSAAISEFVGIWVVFVVLSLAAAGTGVFVKPDK